MKIHKLASIDIGSNAIRLLLTDVYETGAEPIFKKISLHRVPLRLGDEAFTQGFFSKEKQQKFVQTMWAFKYLMDVFEPDAIMVCATSAMRESSNSEELIKKVEKKTGIRIEIISGAKEAEIIYMNHIESGLSNDQNYLYIDVGGGSTELTLFENLLPIASQSFRIGTVRLLNKKVKQSEWKLFKKWVFQHIPKDKACVAIGSGGNISKYLALSDRKKSGEMDYLDILALYKTLKPLSFEERLTQFKLKPDRADVIVPAGKIYTKAMEWAGCDTIQVPLVGLSDGMSHYMYENEICNR